jgi:UDP-N-acetylglucosamine:LPS N-acetylglucosamine transferase
VSDGPSVLVVTSKGASPAAVMPVLAAAEAAGLKVRAIDGGRVGARAEGALDRMLRAVVGELAERRLSKELASYPPDVAITFDPGTTTALTVARDEASKPAPVVAVVAEMDPDKEWGATDADRYLVVDDNAAVILSEHGVDGSRIIPVGAMCERAFSDAQGEDKRALKRRFKISPDLPAVIVEVDGLGYEMTGQIALQLSLTDIEATYLFDAGEDRDAATALRRQVPMLEMRAKLFGRTDDLPLLWRCADVVIARPRPHAIMRAIVLGARMVSFLPDDRVSERVAKSLEQRGLGTMAANALLLTSALEPLLRANPRGDGRIGMDGAANVADVAWVVGKERRSILEERRAAERARTRERVEAAAAAAETVAHTANTAGDLEDLGGGGGSSGGGSHTDPMAGVDVPDEGEIAKLRAEVNTRIKQVSKTVFEAREAAEQWDKRRQQANAAGKTDVEKQAERNADRERARMHAGLAEMAQLESEMKRLESAAAAAANAPRRPPPSSSDDADYARAAAQARSSRPKQKSVDEMLSELKRRESGGGTSTSQKTSGKKKKKRRKKRREADPIDDELAALKRKMGASKRKK